MRANAPLRSVNADTRASLFAAISFRNGVMTIQPAGPTLAEREAMIISREGGAALRDHAKSLRCLVLDLSDVQQISSFGLGLCIELRNAADAEGAGTIIYGLAPDLADLFRMMKVERLYAFADSQTELTRAIDDES